MTANEDQIGGTHYKDTAMHCPHCRSELQHWDVSWYSNFDMFQYAITKYIWRWRMKDGVEALRKARHALDKYIEVIEYEALVREYSPPAAAGRAGDTPEDRDSGRDGGGIPEQRREDNCGPRRGILG